MTRVPPFEVVSHKEHVALDTAIVPAEELGRGPMGRPRVKAGEHGGVDDCEEAVATTTFFRHRLFSTLQPHPSGWKRSSSPGRRCGEPISCR